MAPLFDFRHVTVKRSLDGQRPALDDLSLTIDSGEHVCLLGPNGSGKSTLIKVVTRDCYPVVRDASSVAILGRDRWDIFALRRQLGIVSPDLLGASTSGVTGRDIVLSGFFSAVRIFPHHRPEPEQLASAEESLCRLGIAHLADRPVGQLSAGEAKRVLIARALVHRPHTLLFDEPFSGLDIGAQIQLRETLRELARSGVGIVLVTHQVSEIIPEIQRVVLLAEGRVVADGPKRELLVAEKLSALFGRSLHLEERDGYFHLF